MLNPFTEEVAKFCRFFFDKQLGNPQREWSDVLEYTPSVDSPWGRHIKEALTEIVSAFFMPVWKSVLLKGGAVRSIKAEVHTE